LPLGCADSEAFLDLIVRVLVFLIAADDEEFGIDAVADLVEVSTERICVMYGCLPHEGAS
jgi:hypothetical protein